MTKFRGGPLIALFAFVFPFVLFPIAHAGLLNCSSLFDASRNLLVATKFSEINNPALSQSPKWHKKGVSPLLDDLAFTPFTSASWKDWLLTARTLPNLDYLPRLRGAAIEKPTLDALRLQDIVAKPGHMIVRDPSKINFFAESDPTMSKQWSKGEKPDRAVLNVVTDTDGRILAVDAWDGHHRLLGSLQAGLETLGQLSENGVVLLHNGRDATGAIRNTTPPASGVDFRNSERWLLINSQRFLLPPRTVSRYADVWVNGAVSNWLQGSVFTLRDILYSNTKAPQHKVAVIDVSTTNGQITQRLLQHLESTGFSEVLYISTKGPIGNFRVVEAEKKNTALKANGSKLRVNVYLADATNYILIFGRDAFLRRVQQTYVTLASPQFVDMTSGSADPTKPLGYSAQ